MGYRRASMMRGGGDWTGFLTAMGLLGVSRVMSDGGSGGGSGGDGKGCGCGGVMGIVAICLVAYLVFVVPTQLVFQWAVREYERPVREQEEDSVYEWARGERVRAWAYHDTLHHRSIYAEGEEYDLYQDSLRRAWSRIDEIEEVVNHPPTPRAERIHTWIVVCIVLAWVVIISLFVWIVWWIMEKKNKDSA